MKRYNAIFITAVALCGVAAFTFPKSQPLAAAGEQALNRLAVAQHSVFSTLAEIVSPVAAPFTAGAQLASSGAGVRPVRIAAVRGENHYGWIQLPVGCVVELVRGEGEHLIVRYDGTTVRIPRAAAETGAVVLRPRLIARI